jgi:hypothetical protein
LKNYYPGIWDKWSNRLAEMFLCHYLWEIDNRNVPFESFFLEVELIDTVEGMIYLSSTVLSLLLMALSISAYRNTGLKKMAYAAAAFALFAAYLFSEYFEAVYEFLQRAYMADRDIGIAILPFLLKRK